MSALNSKFRLAGGNKYMHYCPACKTVHGIVVGNGPNDWIFNGDIDNATFHPSVRVETTRPEKDASGQVKMVPYFPCHYWIQNGNIKFCGDSLHALSGKTVPIPDWPYKED